MSGIERTPEACFAHLPDFAWEPHYREVDGLRLAHVDEGSGPPALFVHGEPTWSFLWRHVMPPVLGAGFRCIAPDHAGFGRSDKPTDVAWYSYERHVELLIDLIDHLELRDLTLVVHDWGGPIGLAAAMHKAEAVSGLVLMDTGLFTGEQRMSDAWMAFRAFVERTDDLPVGMLVRRACFTDPGDRVAAAYDAPYHHPAAKAGARAFPLMLPLDPGDPGADLGRQTLDWLARADVPKLVLWAQDDPILTLETGRRLAERIGAPAPEPIAQASHFLQEDVGAQLGVRIADWLSD